MFILKWSERTVKGTIELQEKETRTPGFTPISGTGYNDPGISLYLFGKGGANYAQGQQENFLWLLENFSSAIPPKAPTEGQVWFDNVNKRLNVWINDAKPNSPQNFGWHETAGIEITKSGDTTLANDPNKIKQKFPVVKFNGKLWFDETDSTLWVCTGAEPNWTWNRVNEQVIKKGTYPTIRDFKSYNDGANGDVPALTIPKGAMWFDTAENVLFTFNGTSWDRSSRQVYQQVSAPTVNAPSGVDSEGKAIPGKSALDTGVIWIETGAATADSIGKKPNGFIAKIWNGTEWERIGKEVIATNITPNATQNLLWFNTATSELKVYHNGAWVGAANIIGLNDASELIKLVVPSGTTRTLDEVKNHIDVRGPLHIKIDTLSALRVGMFNTAVSAADGTFTPSDSLIEFGGPMSIGALGVAQTFRAQHEVDASKYYINSNQYFSGTWQVYDNTKAPAGIRFNHSNLNSFISFHTSNVNSGEAGEKARLTNVGQFYLGRTASDTTNSALQATGGISTDGSIYATTLGSKIGIGVTSAATAMHVKSASAAVGTIESSTTSGGQIIFKNATVTAGWQVGISGDGSGNFIFHNNSSNKTILGAALDGTLYLGTAAGTGNVNIGNSTDVNNYKLNVVGKAVVSNQIKAQGISTSAQLILERTATNTGGGSIGADDSYMFRVYNLDATSGGTTLNVTQSGRTIFGSATPLGLSTVQVTGSLSVVNNVGAANTAATTIIGGNTSAATPSVIKFQNGITYLGVGNDFAAANGGTFTATLETSTIGTSIYGTLSTSGNAMIGGNITTTGGTISALNPGTTVTLFGTSTGIIRLGASSTTLELGNPAAAKQVKLRPVDDSTELGNGGTVVEGGMSVAKQLRVGSDFTVTGAANISSNVTIGGNLSVSGNLSIGGGTTTIESTTMAIEDSIIYINKDLTNATTDIDAGIEFKYGNGSTVQRGFFGYDRSHDAFLAAKALTNLEGTSTVNGTLMKIKGSVLEATATTGTAPFIVASTTLVANLNADLLDGQHASYYAPAVDPNGLTAVRKINGLTANAQGEIAIPTGGSPVGTICAFPAGFNFAGTGWYECNGQTLSATDPLLVGLYNKIGVTYGGTVGVNYRVPDLRGLFIRGYGTNGIDATAISGSLNNTIQQDAFKAHSHAGSTAAAGGQHTHGITINGAGALTGSTDVTGAHTHSYTYRNAQLPQSGSATNCWTGTSTQQTSSNGDHSHNVTINDHTHSATIANSTTHSHTLSITNEGATETRPKNMAMVYAIKAYDPTDISNQSAVDVSTLIAGKVSKTGDTINEIYNDGWYRSNGQTGWYSQTYGGGIWMTDSTYVRVYNGKSFRCDGEGSFGSLNSANGLTISGGGLSVTGGLTTYANPVISNSSPTIYFADTDNMTAAIHVNSNLFYVLRHPTAGTASWDSGPNGRHPMILNLSDGNVTFSGDVYAYSDARLKTDVKTIESALEKVLGLRGVEFKMDGKDKMGLIAQEVQKIIPSVVNETEDKMLTVAYGNIVGLLIESIKELNDKVAKLEEKLKD